MGLAFTKEADRPTAPSAWTHGNNVFGEHQTIKIGSHDGAMTAGYGYRQLYLRAVHPGSGANDGWWLGTQSQAFHPGDGDMYFSVTRGGYSSVPAMIQDSVSSATQMNMTGQHRVKYDEYSDDKIGLIVISKGVFFNLNKCVSPTINDSLPEVQLCNTPQDKRVFGVISNREDSGSRKHAVGNFVSMYDKTDGIDRVFINSLGEGSVWVCSANGNIQNGDYITSSQLAGYGQRQNDDVLHNWTVAKSTQDCNFANLPSWIATRMIDEGYIGAFIGCTYHCG